MNAPTDTTLVQRTEWVLGIGEPKPPSRFGLASFAFLATLSIGALIWSALPGERIDGADAPMTGITFLWLYLVAETGGSFLYARRGVWWGRALRAIGHAFFLPLSMVFYLLWWWSASTTFFVVISAFLGIGVVILAFRLVRLARRSE
jgi:hypothetical protein